MSAVKNALIRTRGHFDTIRDFTVATKAKGGGGINVFSLTPAAGLAQTGAFQQQAAGRGRYAQFRGWAYAAINAIGQEGAGQPCRVGKLKQQNEKKPGKTKSQNHWLVKAPKDIRCKAENRDLEMDLNHPLISSLDRPNPIQTRTQFVYSCIANICLTGWSFVVGGPKESEDETGGKKKKKGKEKYEFFSIPTTWVTPDHTEGAFSKFKIQNPANPENATILDKSQVCFMYFPNPADPFAALSPTMAQQMGIKIDDYIQTSQSVFFENGVFPSVVVKVGANPHPSAPGQAIRPRITPEQRRQIYAAIHKVQAGVANYGNPAIVDGLIESIDRISADANEMGWEKSEKSVRTRILSAFGVHPYILGEEAPGSYAQAYNVQERFYKKVNTFLGMLSMMMSNFCGQMLDDEDLLVWWEELEAKDPQQEAMKWNQGRQRGDVTQNEYRAMMGLPPDEDGEESEIEKSMIQPIVALATAAQAGGITREQAQAILEGAGLSSDLAKKIAGEGEPMPPPGSQEDTNLKVPPDPFADAGVEDGFELDPELGAIEQAADALKFASAVLMKSPDEVAEAMMEELNQEEIFFDKGGPGSGPRGSGRKPDPAQNPKLAKQVEWLKSLTPDEVDAFQTWKTSDGCKGMIKADRGEETHYGESEALAKIYKAMERAPVAKGNLFRGMADLGDGIDQFKKAGTEFELNNLSSFTRSSKVAKGFAVGRMGDKEDSVVFVLRNNKSSKNINGMGKRGEYETLTPKGTKYRVKSFSQKEGRSAIVEIEEI
jgi:phage portal protein BeeE